MSIPIIVCLVECTVAGIATKYNHEMKSGTRAIKRHDHLRILGYRATYLALLRLQAKTSCHQKVFEALTAATASGCPNSSSLFKYI
jgi:hypothetical protein